MPKRKMSREERGRKVAADINHPWRRWNEKLFKKRQGRPKGDDKQR